MWKTGWRPISYGVLGLVMEMRETLKEVGIKTGLGPGIDIVDLRDRLYVTMSLGASLHFFASHRPHVWIFSRQLCPDVAVQRRSISNSARCSAHVVGVGATTRITPMI